MHYNKAKPCKTNDNDAIQKWSEMNEMWKVRKRTENHTTIPFSGYLWIFFLSLTCLVRLVVFRCYVFWLQLCVCYGMYICVCIFIILYILYFSHCTHSAQRSSCLCHYSVTAFFFDAVYFISFHFFFGWSVFNSYYLFSWILFVNNLCRGDGIWHQTLSFGLYLFSFCIQ